MITSRMVVTAGLVCRGAVRRKLEAAQFMGKGFTFREVKGWLESDFHIEGDALTLGQIERWVNTLNTETPI